MASTSEEPYEAEEHAVNEAEDHAVYLEEQPKKKKRINEPLDWIDALNRAAGIMHLPGAHKDRNNEYGDFHFRRNWITEKG